MKPYPSYKDSVVEWIGEIPSGWALSNVKYLLKDDGFRSGPFGSSLITNQLAESGNYLVYTPEHLTDKKIEYPLFVPLEREDELKKYEIRDGDIVLPIVGTLGRGKLFTSQDKKGILNQRLCRISPDPNKVVFQYILNFLTNTNLVKIQFDLEKKGSILDHITREIIFNLQLPFPPLPEQQQIVSFLDHKTQKIDELIEKTEKKIELLKEKRTSLINHCVTKGLNPNVRMEDSGVEWIGEIPSHWNTKKVKYIFEIKKIISREEGYDVLSVTQQGIKIKDIISGKGQLSMDYTKYQIVNIGDFVMNHMDLLTGYVDISKWFGVTSPDYRVFSLIDEKCVDRYYLYLFQTGYKNRIFYGFGQGSSKFGRWRLPSKQFNNFKFPYPSYEEQQQIGKYLDEQTQKIDSIIEKEIQQIELLKEYSQSLISEVVTGKIDVRDEVVV